jgi:hypothetical protein
LLACAILVSWAGPVRADSAKAEIESLLVAVGQSGCGFVRNGSEHTSVDAERHLRMKYRKGERFVDTPEHFIERLASGSSWTGQPYRVHCPGEPERLSSSWLKGLLDAQRRSETADPGAHP